MKKNDWLLAGRRIALQFRSRARSLKNTIGTEQITDLSSDGSSGVHNVPERCAEPSPGKRENLDPAPARSIDTEHIISCGSDNQPPVEVINDELYAAFKSKLLADMDKVNLDDYDFDFLDEAATRLEKEVNMDQGDGDRDSKQKVALAITKYLGYHDASPWAE